MFIKDNIIPNNRDCKIPKKHGMFSKVCKKLQTQIEPYFCKLSFFSIKKEENENIRNFTSCIKDISDKLGDIGEKVCNTDLVTITFKGLVQDYKFFISTLSARPNPLTFDDLNGILLKEEERMKDFDLDSNSLDLALIKKCKHRSKP